MAPLMYLSFRRVLVFLLVFLFASSVLLLVSSEGHPDVRGNQQQVFGRRRVLEKLDVGADDEKPKIKSSSSSKNQTKLLKPSLSSNNQTRVVKNNLSLKNQTKLGGSKSSNSTGKLSGLSKSELKNLNSTSPLMKKLNSTKASTMTGKQSSDLMKLSSPKNKTSKLAPTKQVSGVSDKKKSSSDGSGTSKPSKKNQEKPSKQDRITKAHKLKQIKPFWLEDDDDDLVSEFRDLPAKFHRSLIPDIERISTTSKIYITKANKEITRGFKPYFGNKYAPTIASVVSCTFILVPLLLVSLIINRFKAYFSLQKILIFIQVYLSIYFSILCLSSIVTGLEPLKFFYATSRPTYVWLQVLQTLGYVLYLLLLLMYLVLAYSTDTGLGLKLLSLAQTVVGFSIGLHYYVAVFHRVVTHQPPRTNWKVHAIYATCFLLICLFSRAGRRKKAYLEDGGEEGKKN